MRLDVGRLNLVRAAGGDVARVGARDGAAPRTTDAESVWVRGGWRTRRQPTAVVHEECDARSYEEWNAASINSRS